MDIEFQMTCTACPEQYDAVLPDETVVGYLRLRHGVFTVSASPGSPTLFYQAFPISYGDEALEPEELDLLDAGIDTNSDGVFVSWSVRDAYLAIAKRYLSYNIYGREYNPYD